MQENCTMADHVNGAPATHLHPGAPITRIADPHVAMMAERAALVTAYEAEPDDAASSALFAELWRADERILVTPAATQAGALAQLQVLQWRLEHGLTMETTDLHAAFTSAAAVLEGVQHG